MKNVCHREYRAVVTISGTQGNGKQGQSGSRKPE